MSVKIFYTVWYNFFTFMLMLNLKCFQNLPGFMKIDHTKFFNP